MNILDYFPEKKYKIALKILRKLRDIGFECFFVGGCVRDALLEIEPDDIDIVTNANPSSITSMFKSTDQITQNYGVTKVVVDDEIFDISSYRKDGVYNDGRHPETVSVATIEEDSGRRDFTINSIYFDPIYYEFKDFHNGLLDIENKKIKTIGIARERFLEDRLRIIRAIRLNAQLNFEFEQEIFSAIDNIDNKTKGISNERIVSELNKCLLGPASSKCFKLLDKFNILESFFPELTKLKTIKLEAGISCWDNMMRMLDVSEYKDLTLLWSILFVNLVGICDINLIMKRLKFSNKHIKNISYICLNHEKLLNPKSITKAELKNFMSADTFILQLKLLQLSLVKLDKAFDPYEYLKSYHDDFEKIFPEPIVNGNTLIDIGLKPNSKFSKIINKSYLAQLEGKISNLDDATTFIKVLASQ